MSEKVLNVTLYWLGHAVASNMACLFINAHWSVHSHSSFFPNTTTRKDNHQIVTQSTQNQKKENNNPAFSVFTALMIVFMEKNYNQTGKRTWTRRKKRRKRERAPTMIVSGHKKSCHQLQTWTWKLFHAGTCVSPRLLSLRPSIFPQLHSGLQQMHKLTQRYHKCSVSGLV